MTVTNASQMHFPASWTGYFTVPTHLVDCAVYMNMAQTIYQAVLIRGLVSESAFQEREVQ